jgi:hypothetical protein
MAETPLLRLLSSPCWACRYARVVLSIVFFLFEKWFCLLLRRAISWFKEWSTAELETDSADSTAIAFRFCRAFPLFLPISQCKSTTPRCMATLNKDKRHTMLHSVFVCSVHPEYHFVIVWVNSRFCYLLEYNGKGSSSETGNSLTQLSYMQVIHIN